MKSERQIVPYDLSSSNNEMSRARQVIGGGLSSSARVRSNQVVFERAQGAYLWDVDGNKYIDTVCAHGPILLENGHPEITAAIAKSVERGVQYGGPHRDETTLGEHILKFLPWADKVTYLTSGSEAVQLALRIARVKTGRKLILKFDGHYHGWIDPLYLKVPSVNNTLSNLNLAAKDCSTAVPVPSQSSAIDPSPSPDVIVGKWNDLEHFRNLMRLYGSKTAAIIFEPFATNFGTFRPDETFLAELITLAHEHGVLVIFDEIVTGFRVAPGGAAEMLGLSPDIGVYGKALGSGFPISAVAGTKDAMEVLDDGRVLTAGTFSGSPVSVAAARATLEVLDREQSTLYGSLQHRGERLKHGLEEAGKRVGLSVTVNQIGSLAQMFIGEIVDLTSIEAINQSNKNLVAEICEEMILHGIYTSRKGLFYLNSAHTDDDIDEISWVFEQVLASN